jgi:uncharacterized protein (DUF924 family)
MTTSLPQDEILEFWFGPAPHAERNTWFRKDPAFDAEIRSRFGAVIESALAGGWPDAGTTSHGSLRRAPSRPVHAQCVPRHAARVRGHADWRRCAVDAGQDRRLDKYECWFLYMPFEHSEDRAVQGRSLALFGALAADAGEPGNLQWAKKHAAIVRRFGRFPHRNAILGRTSTPEEIAFLREPGSRF